MNLLKNLSYLFCGLVMLLFINHLSPYGIALNRTNSIPQGVYLKYPLQESALNMGLSREDLVCFYYHAPSWAKDRKYQLENFKICKKVLGIPSDEVIVSENKVYIKAGNSGSILNAGSFLPTDSLNRPMPYKINSQVIPPRYYYLGATYIPNSLDSRYLGLISEGYLAHRIYPLWTW